jgi:basic secretory peptidase family protein
MITAEEHRSWSGNMTERRLLTELRARLTALAPTIASSIGLTERPFSLEWAPSGTSSAAFTYAEQGRICLSPTWFRAHPDDDGCLAHEYTHLLQNVPGGTCPSEVIEGFADSVRYLLGLYDPGWWRPSDIASRIAALPGDDYRRLSRAMAAGTYAEFVWP